MVWPFTFDWCVLCARELVRSVIRTPCCRLLVHKACLYSALAISPSRPTPTCPHCQQVLDLGRFRRLCWRLSGKWSPWFECPLAPMSPSRSFLPWGYLQSMDPPPPPPPPSSPGPPDDHDDRVSGTHRLNVSRAPDTPCSFFLCSFHLGATTTTTTTTTTIVTTPRRQAIAGKCLFRSR